VLGVTPEAPDVKEVFGDDQPERRLRFAGEETRETAAKLNKYQDHRVDLVAIGCPHASIREIGHVAGLLEGKRLASDTDLWLLTAVSTKTMADRMGYTSQIENAGGRVVCDTCPVLGSTAAVLSKHGYKSLATNSAKLAHYSPGSWNLDTFYGNLESCIQAASNGRWIPNDRN